MDCLEADYRPSPRIDVRVIRIRTRETIADSRIKALILRAVEASHYLGTTPQAFYDEIADNIAGDMLGVFVGFTKWQEHSAPYPIALTIVFLPMSETQMGPQVPIAYSESRELSLLIGKRVRVWLTENGYDKLYCLNLLHDDDAYCRVFRHVGEPRVVGSVVEVML